MLFQKLHQISQTHCCFRIIHCIMLLSCFIKLYSSKANIFSLFWHLCIGYIPLLCFFTCLSHLLTSSCRSFTNSTRNHQLIPSSCHLPVVHIPLCVCYAVSNIADGLRSNWQRVFSCLVFHEIFR